MAGRTVHSRVRGGGEQPPIAHVQLKGQPAVISSWCLSWVPGWWVILLLCTFMHFPFFFFGSNQIITFKIEGHMLIKRKLFFLIGKGFKILQSLSLKCTREQLVPKPLPRKTSETSTCGREMVPRAGRVGGRQSNFRSITLSSLLDSYSPGSLRAWGAQVFFQLGVGWRHENLTSALDTVLCILSYGWGNWAWRHYGLAQRK